MSLFYLDASALAKVYLKEVGSEWVRRIVSSETILTSSIVIAEVASALGRRTREGDLSSTQSERIFLDFMEDIYRFDVVRVSDALLRDAAGHSLAQHVLPLRALDSIHLATARWSFILSRQSDAADTVFVAADHRLLRAAEAAGLRTENPEDHA